jgi:hypothetical protein
MVLRARMWVSGGVRGGWRAGCKVVGCWGYDCSCIVNNSYARRPAPCLPHLPPFPLLILPNPRKPVALRQPDADEVEVVEVADRQRYVCVCGCASTWPAHSRFRMTVDLQIKSTYTAPVRLAFVVFAYWPTRRRSLNIRFDFRSSTQ